jgi:hypothetical protein
MMKVIFEQEENELEAETVLKKKKIVGFGTGGAHITVPLIHKNKYASVVVHKIVGSWASHMKKFTEKKAKK